MKMALAEKEKNQRGKIEPEIDLDGHLSIGILSMISNPPKVYVEMEIDTKLEVFHCRCRSINSQKSSSVHDGRVFVLYFHILNSPKEYELFHPSNSNHSFIKSLI